MRKRQHGLGAIAAIMILVLLAGLAAAIVSMSTAQHLSSALDVQSARAWQAARAGNEWGLDVALHNGDWGGGGACTPTVVGTPVNRSVTLNLTAETGFSVFVACAGRLYNEGETVPGTARTVQVFEITSIACNVAPCPNNAAAGGAGYVERRRVVIATK